MNKKLLFLLLFIPELLRAQYSNTPAYTQYSYVNPINGIYPLVWVSGNRKFDPFALFTLKTDPILWSNILGKPTFGTLSGLNKIDYSSAYINNLPDLTGFLPLHGTADNSVRIGGYMPSMVIAGSSIPVTNANGEAMVKINAANVINLNTHAQNLDQDWTVTSSNVIAALAVSNLVLNKAGDSTRIPTKFLGAVNGEVTPNYYTAGQTFTSLGLNSAAKQPSTAFVSSTDLRISNWNTPNSGSTLNNKAVTAGTADKIVNQSNSATVTATIGITGKSISMRDSLGNLAANNYNIGNLGTDLVSALNGKQSNLTLTTTGNGAATLSGAILNIPTPPSYTSPVTSVNNKTGSVNLAEADIPNLVSDLAAKQATLPTNSLAFKNTSDVLTNNTTGNAATSTTANTILNQANSATIPATTAITGNYLVQMDANGKITVQDVSLGYAGQMLSTILTGKQPLLSTGTVNQFRLGDNSLIAKSTDNVPEGNSNLYFTTGRSAAAAPIQSVFGRTGAITATAADYSAYYPLLSSTYTNPSWIGSLAWSKITATPTSIVGYGIIPTFGDYSNYYEPIISPGTSTAQYWNGGKQFVDFNTSARKAFTGGTNISVNQSTGVIASTGPDMFNAEVVQSGTNTKVTLAHGLTGVTSASKFAIQPTNALSGLNYGNYITWDATNIYIYYSTTTGGTYDYVVTYKIQ